MSIYEHYREHEHPFVDQSLSWIREVESTFTPFLTHFLDPREQKIIRTILGNSHEFVRIDFFGGDEKAERKRCLFYPYYEEVDAGSFEVQLIEGHFPKKFVKIEHKDILGSLMSLGIERKTIGDIYLFDDKFHIVIISELTDYILLNFHKIKTASIQLEKKPLEVIQFIEGHWHDRHVIVSSLRLDVIVKEIYQIPRTKAVKLIENNRVKLNHQIVNQVSIQVEASDLISVRGLGRSQVDQIGGKTRKNKTILQVKILKDN